MRHSRNQQLHRSAATHTLARLHPATTAAIPIPRRELATCGHHQQPDLHAWTECTKPTPLLFPDTDTGTSTAAAARFHLEHIIEAANGVLHLLTGRP
ncbi:hypothetical protein [Nocardia noduli]|uniref:hypothetical protein n=1 Tax=Nocardia noduli TaxID=2815722 RepID=UPI001C2347F3|nr:hypothetical protein [Nocardia noduli]